MTLLKEESVPIAPEEIQLIRSRLVRPHDYEIVDRNGLRYLFLRAAGPEPDPVADLEVGLEGVPSWVAHNLSAVLLLTEKNGLHVPAYNVLPLLEARNRLENEIAREGRSRVDIHFGFVVSRLRGDPRNLERLIVRVPRERVVELSEADLVALAQSLGPSLDAGDFRHVRVCHVVAQEDHLRFRAADFLEDIAARWGPLRPAPSLPIPIEPVSSHPIQTPKRVVQAEPLFELEQELRAVDDPQQALLRLQVAQSTLHQIFEQRGFRVTPNDLVGGTPYTLTAERKTAYPRRVAVKVEANFTRLEAEAAIRESRTHAWDQLYVLALAAEPETATLVATSKVKVLRLDEVGSLVP